MNNFKYPDLFIAKKSKDFAGLFIEYKKDGTVLYKKDGSMRKNEHIEGQNRALQLLQTEGYYAVFSIGVKKTKKLITQYLAGMI